MPSALDQQHLAFARLLELSELMLSNALNGLWDVVVDLQRLRDGLIKDLFSQSLDLDGYELASGIEYILDCDQQLAAAVVDEKKFLQKQIISIKQSTAVERAYSGF